MIKKIDKNRIFGNKTVKIAGRSILTIAVIIIVLVFCVGRPVYNIFKERANYRATLKENKRLKTQTDELENSVKWLQTTEGIEGIAHEYGMVSEGEETILFPPQDEALVDPNSEASDSGKIGAPLILISFLIIVIVPIFVIVYIKGRLKKRQEKVEEEDGDDNIYIKRK